MEKNTKNSTPASPYDLNDITHIKTLIVKFSELVKKHPWVTLLIASIIYSTAHYYVFSHHYGYVSFFSIDPTNISFDFRATLNIYFPLIAVFLISLYIAYMISITNSYKFFIPLVSLFLLLFFLLAVLYIYISPNSYILETLAVSLFCLPILTPVLYFSVFPPIKEEKREKPRGKFYKKYNAFMDKILQPAGVLMVVTSLIILLSIPYHYGEKEARKMEEFKTIQNIDTTNTLVVYETKENYFCVPYITKEDETITFDLGTYTIIPKENKTVEIKTYKVSHETETEE